MLVTPTVQVCKEDVDSLPERELDGLMEAMKATDLTEGTVITRAMEDEREI